MVRPNLISRANFSVTSNNTWHFTNILCIHKRHLPSVKLMKSTYSSNLCGFVQMSLLICFITHWEWGLRRGRKLFFPFGVLSVIEHLTLKGHYLISLIFTRSTESQVRYGWRRNLLLSCSSFSISIYWHTYLFPLPFILVSNGQPLGNMFLVSFYSEYPVSYYRA